MKGNGLRNGQALTEDERATIGPRPPLKWVGGKWGLLPQFEPLLPRCALRRYAEPFVGGGAVFFRLLPENGVLIDKNEELINFYCALRDSAGALIGHARRHRNDRNYYLSVRAMNPADLDPLERASRFLYLNKAGYNGLWRVNSQGKHNVPFGRYENPRIVDEANLRLVSEALKTATLVAGDFQRVLDYATPGVFVYLDPPYHPVSQTANFTSYTAGSFNEADQRRLAEVFRKLDERGCLVMVSNSDTEFIRREYAGYGIQVVKARRAINCRGDRRGPVRELVIRNYASSIRQEGITG